MSLVELRAVAPESASTLSNLIELYCHDLSAVFGLHIGADGRYGYPALDAYWQQPGQRFAFFIMADNELAGFALVTRGSPATDDPTDFDVAEFFVLRPHRARGVGKQAAFLLWDHLPGHWVIRAAANNEPAVCFWRRTASAYAANTHTERTLELQGITRHVFELLSTRCRTRC